MRIFKLEPIDRTSPDWQYSEYPNDQYPDGVVFVQAESPDNARRIAAGTFQPMGDVEAHRGEKMGASPWLQASLVSAVEDDSSEYVEEKKKEDERIVGSEETLEFLRYR